MWRRPGCTFGAIAVLGLMSGYFGFIGLVVWSVARFGPKSMGDDELVPTWIPWTFGGCIATGAVLGLTGLLLSPFPGPLDGPPTTLAPIASERVTLAVMAVLHLAASGVVFFGAPDSAQRWAAVGFGFLPFAMIPLFRRMSG